MKLTPIRAYIKISLFMIIIPIIVIYATIRAFLETAVERWFQKKSHGKLSRSV